MSNPNATAGTGMPAALGDVASPGVMNSHNLPDHGDKLKAAKQIEALFVDADGVAALLAVSRRTVIRLDQSEQLPAPTRWGRLVRWSVSELRAWDAAGRPPRKRWNWKGGRFNG